jgi:hypothetical protein
MNGMTIGNIREIGRTIKCTGKAYLHGLMEENMRVNTGRIRSKAKGLLSGQTEGDMMENGLMANNMEWDYM